MQIKEYCKQENISLSEFARREGVCRQQVTKWVNADWFVYNGKLNSPKRDLKGEK